NDRNNFAITNLRSYVLNGHGSAPIISYIQTGIPPGNYPTSIMDWDLQVFYYYDDYTNAPSRACGRNFDNSFSADYLSGTQMITPLPYSFTLGKLIATRIKRIDPHNLGLHFKSDWTTAVYFYDEKGRVIQTQTLNPWNNSQWDVSTIQYNFTGDPVLSINTHY